MTQPAQSIFTKYREDLEDLYGAFPLPTSPENPVPFGSGHINDTFLLTCPVGPTGKKDFVLQRINHNIFMKPDVVMENIARVVDHISGKLDAAEVSDRDRRVLKLIPARGGSPWWESPRGYHWRLYERIPNTVSVDEAQHPFQAEQAAKAFGRFQRDLLDLPGVPLGEAIPRFHDAEHRYRRFLVALAEADPDRVDAATELIDFAHTQQGMASLLATLQRDGEIPIRITHNDTKINNVLLDEETGEGLCVIDLDTVMPGLIHYDFGDLVRTGTCRAAEDERDLSIIRIESDLFEAVVRGYLSETRDFLNPKELELLVFSGKLMTFVIGLRFLTDFLQNDRYFRTHRPQHNMQRAAAQFQLVRSITKRQQDMEELVSEIARV